MICLRKLGFLFPNVDKALLFSSNLCVGTGTERERKAEEMVERVKKKNEEVETVVREREGEEISRSHMNVGYSNCARTSANYIVRIKFALYPGGSSSIKDKGQRLSTFYLDMSGCR